MHDIEENKRIVLECFRALGADDRESLRTVMTEDAEIWVPDGIRFSGTYTPDGYLSAIRDGVGPLAAGEAKVDVLSLTAEEDRVSMEVVSHMPLKNGKTYNNKYHFMFTVKDGKVVNMKEYMNTRHVVQTIDAK